MSALLSTVTGVTFSAPSPTIYTRAVPVSFSGVVSGTALSALGVQYQEIWQFGDGTFSYESKPTHIYKEKGVYPVLYTVVLPNSGTGEVNDEIKTVTATVSVFNFIEDRIEWTSGAPGTFQSVPQSTPFIISLSSSNVDTVTPLIQLYSRGSQSQPWQEPQQKWSHLKPQWRFTDVDGTVISSLQPEIYTTITIDQSGNRLLDGTGIVVGLSATVECFYIDDLPSQNIDNTVVPVTLVATLVTSGYQVEENTVKYVPSFMNSPIFSETTHNIKFLSPHHLKVTANGITPMNDVIWKGAFTPYTVTVHPDAPYEDVILKNFPLTNFLTNTFIQSLSTVPASSVEFTTDIDLNRFDSDGFDTGGYFRGTLYPLISADQTVVAVSGVVIYGVLAEPFGAWLSNPTYNEVVYVTITNTTGTDFISAIYTIPNSQVYGIARVTGDVNDGAWVTDSTNDKVYRITRSFGVDRNFDLSTYAELSSVISDNDFGVTPTGIVLNSSRQPWVTLFDAVSTIKLDPDTGSILAVAVPSASSIFIDIPGLSGFGGENTVRPAEVEVDSFDNIWVAYNHPLSSFLVKYQDDGSIATTVQLPRLSKPYDIITDNQGNLWVTLSYAISALSGVVQKYSSSGTLLSSISSFRVPSYITLDHSQNPWFVNDYNKVTFINNSTGSTTTYVVSSSTLSADPPSNVNLNVLYDQELGGISCDWFNRIWVLNSYDNRAYMINAASPSDTKVELQILPAANNFTYSLQAYGDWHGLQWFNKFGYAPLSAIGDNVTLNLTGQSNVFSVQDFLKSYNIRKIHEDFDGVNKIRDITLQQNIKRNDILFSKLIAPIAGTYDGDPLQLGTAIFEKISNYVMNQGDVDTCNIHQLNSLHEMINIPIDQYDLAYPADIKRIIDLLSLNLTHLKPTRSKFSKDFKKYNVASSGQNIGPLIDTATYTASAGQNIVVNLKYTTNFEKIELTPITSDVLNIPQLSATYSGYPLSAFPLSAFPLSAYYGWGLDVPVSDFYFFYTYVSGYDNTQVEGVIDWDNTNTTLTENISSIDEWYKDGGIVDLIFSFYIFQGLNLITDSVSSTDN